MPLPHIDAALAQQVEHIHGKDGVSGPNPEGGSTLKQAIARVFALAIFMAKNKTGRMSCRPKDRLPLS